jgi:hypothetical protein
MLPNLAIGGAVIPGLRRLHIWELEDDSPFRRGSFEVFVQAVKSKNLDLVSGESRRDFFGVDGQLMLIECLVPGKDQVCAHGDLRSSPGKPGISSY